jgi:hypothetical protein
MNGFRIFFTVLLNVSTIILITSCSPKTNTSAASVGIPGPPCIVYKTKQDYFDKVPVILSPDRSKIVSFPDPADLRLPDGYPTPLRLDSGYLLDRRGISSGVAFLNITYAGYAAFASVPPVNYLAANILDSDPLTAMYECDLKRDDPELVEKLNRLIGEGELRSMKRLK